MNDVGVHGELTGENLLEVSLHFFDLTSESLESAHLVLDLDGEIVDGYILDVSQQMLNTDLLSLGSIDDGRNVNEVLNERTVLINLFN